jgi:signal transduction histidine kinase
MSRALKILSRSQRPETPVPEGSACEGIPKKRSTPDSGIQTVKPARFNLSLPFSLSPTPGSIPPTSHLWLETKLRLEESSGRRPTRKAEREERIALETINKLMVTISHYLNNPLTVLLGRVELLSEATENGGMLKGEIKRFTESCKREIHRIESIIKVFQNLCEVRYKTYPPGIKMLDVEKEIKNRLKEVESFNMIETKKRE